MSFDIKKNSHTLVNLIPSIEVRLPFLYKRGESCLKYADMRYRTINAFFSTQILYDDKLKNLSKKRLNQLGRFSFFWTFCFDDYTIKQLNEENSFLRQRLKDNNLE